MSLADSIIGAVEAQKAEGVLHWHLFPFLVCAHQFKNLTEIAEMLKQKLLSVDTFKIFVDHARRASYPDVDKFNAERREIEKAWPAYAQDNTLCQVPFFVGELSSQTFAPSSVDWNLDATRWLEQYNGRLQHVMSRMNHHIHPSHQRRDSRAPSITIVPE